MRGILIGLAALLMPGCGAQDVFWYYLGAVSGAIDGQGIVGDGCVSGDACGPGMGDVGVDDEGEDGVDDDGEGHEPIDTGGLDGRGPPDNRPPDHAGRPAVSAEPDNSEGNGGNDSDLGDENAHDNPGGHDDSKVVICHRPACPEPPARSGVETGAPGRTIDVAESAVAAHLAHGDYEGACDE